MDLSGMQALVWMPLFLFFAFIPGSTLNAVESTALSTAATPTTTTIITTTTTSAAAGATGAAGAASISSTATESKVERAPSLLSDSIDDKTFLKTQSITQPAQPPAYSAASSAPSATAPRTIAAWHRAAIDEAAVDGGNGGGVYGEGVDGVGASSVSATGTRLSPLAAGSLVRAATNVNLSIGAQGTPLLNSTAERRDEATATTTTTTAGTIIWATTIAQVTMAAAKPNGTSAAAAVAVAGIAANNVEHIITNGVSADGGGDGGGAAAIVFTPLHYGGYSRQRNNNVHDEAPPPGGQVETLHERWAPPAAANNVTAGMAQTTTTESTATTTTTTTSTVALPTADIDSNSLDGMNRPSSSFAQRPEPFGAAATSISDVYATTEAAAATTTTSSAKTTRRRIVATTTLKPPPTIDDYQTITSQAGTHAYLPCNVKQLVKKPISWLRVRDGHILTVDQTTFIADQRFQSIFTTNPERWSLQIKYVQLKDAGTYECQVSTEPKASAIVSLHIVEPRTELIGESTRHVKAGSQVKLHCVISQALEPPLFINWFYNQKQIYLHNRKGWRTEIERIDLPPSPTPTQPPPSPPTTTTTSTSTTAATTTSSTTSSTWRPAMLANEMPEAITSGGGSAMSPPLAHDGAAAVGALGASSTREAATKITATTAAASTSPATASATARTAWTTTTSAPANDVKQITTASLIIPAVLKQDSGNYTCSPSNSAPRTVVLHVLNGEYSASAITSGGDGRHCLPHCLQWHSTPAILTLLWIIKILYAHAGAPWCRHSGRRGMRSRGASVDNSRMCYARGRLGAAPHQAPGTPASRSGNVKSTISAAEMGEKT